ncbi:hypothetical protein CTheo_5035 [Ceratobasidium theobromae]|uniref:Uncharacterized protein n=1 Tax=Ceratobasidium theobromae TaxID=1582974 RepID=A0A5N5QJ64_9AGAM|nr:hypothetical protein CTheo_5035 [Ceratobasidium theobromae]
MADIGAEYVFPNYAQVDAKLTINGPGRKVVLRPAAELPPFFGKLLLFGHTSEPESLPGEPIPGTVRFNKDSPPAGSGIAEFSIQNRHLLILFFPKDEDIRVPNALVSSEPPNSSGNEPFGDLFLYKRAEGEWTFELHQE